MTLYHQTPDCQRVLSYARGNIILLRPQGKKPMHDDWVTAPSPVNGDARGYFDLDYNLGFRIPKDHLIIDVDPRNGGLESYALLPEEVRELPATTISPSGGFHVYTRLPEDQDYRLLKTKAKEFPGIDFLHYGKQVVLPGSRLTDSTGWRLGPAAVFPPPEVPPSLMDILRRQAPASSPDELESYLSNYELETILSMIPVNRYRDNDSWLKMAMACHHATDGLGLPAFLAWSITDPLYADQSEIIRRRWESMANDNTPAPVTIRSLVRELTAYAPVPSWLLVRSNLQTSPEEFFGKMEKNFNESQDRFESLGAQIDACTDHLTLLTSLSSKIGMDSSLTESMREILLKKISKKTGTSLTSLRKDIKLMTAPKFTDIGLDGPEDQEANGDLSQPHTAAAQTTIASLSANGMPPAFCMGKWLMWDSQRWAEGRAEIDIRREAHKALYNQGTAVTGPAIRSVVEIIKTLMEVSPTAFEPKVDEIKIFTPFRVLKYDNGWIDSLPSPEHRNLMTTGVAYNPNAPRPVEWLWFLEQSLTSEKAQRTIACSIVYAMAQCRPWLRKAVYLYGPKRSGKSTILNAIQEMIGRANCSALNMRQLGGEHGLASLVGKLANISNETLSADVIQDDTFKSLISGEAVQVNPKNSSLFVYHNTTKLFFGANGFPRVQDESDATFDRLTIISCPHGRNREECDTELGLKIREELSGVLNWAMQIFHEEYQKDRCTSIMDMDDKAAKVMQEWQETNNPALRWFAERTEAAESGDDILPMSTAYADYRMWCDSCGHKRLNKIHFGRQISRRDPRRKIGEDGKRGLPRRRLKPIEDGAFRALL